MELLRSGLGLCVAMFTMAAVSAADSYVYAGTYTGKGSKGIYVYRFQPASGQMESIGVAETPNPTFLAVHPNNKWLFAANEIGNYQGTKTGSVTAFSIDAATGKLTALNTVSSKGNGPCHVSVDRSGKFVLVANY